MSGLTDILKGATGGPIGLGIGVLGAIGKAIGRGVANKKMNTLLKQDPRYQENPLAGQRLGMAQALLNARMPGAMQVERNIFRNQANATAASQMGATDASQLLAAAGDIQGRANQAVADLGVNEAQDYQRRFENLVGAQQGVINEQDKVFQDRVRRYGNLVGVRSAQQQNRQNTWGDISNLGFGLADFSLSGGFGGGANQGVSGYGTNMGIGVNYGLLNSLRNQPRYNPLTGKIE